MSLMTRVARRYLLYFPSIRLCRLHQLQYYCSHPIECLEKLINKLTPGIRLVITGEICHFLIMHLETVY